MFDKNLFDRNAFDRSVSSDGLPAVTILSSGSLGLRILVTTPLSIPLTGHGNLRPNIVARRNVRLGMNGNGEINQLPILLRRTTVSKIDGAGDPKFNFTVKTPIAANLSGGGSVGISNRFIAAQLMKSTIGGIGSFTTNLIAVTEMSKFSFVGSGIQNTVVIFQLPMAADISSIGGFSLRRLSALNENVIELLGIEILPGETVTIDTDLLQVLIGSREDVSSVTTDSVFFELNPGQNEITVSTDSGGPIEISAIWQNRWL